MLLQIAIEAFDDVLIGVIRAPTAHVALEAVWLGGFLLDRLDLVRRRRALCEAVQCLLLYCRRHPLSARGWRSGLRVSLTGLFASGFALALVWSTGVDNSQFAFVTVRVLTVSIRHQLLVCPAALLAALCADLRLEITAGSADSMAVEARRAGGPFGSGSGCCTT